MRRIPPMQKARIKTQIELLVSALESDLVWGSMVAASQILREINEVPEIKLMNEISGNACLRMAEHVLGAQQTVTDCPSQSVK